MFQTRHRLTYEHSVGVVFVASMFMSIMDSTILNVVLPTLGHQFKATTAAAQWVIVGYLLSTAVVVPASGWVGDRFGTKRTILTAISIFIGASLLCALSQNLQQLIAFRVAQGFGGGMIMPLGMTLLLRAYPPERRVRASRILMIPTVIAPASGPIIGGAIITGLSWRWIFLVNVPMGIAVVIFGKRVLIEHKEPPRGRFDFVGFLLSASGLALLLYALSEAPILGWNRPDVIVAALAGALALGVFVRIELRQASPLLELRLLHDRIFRRINVVSAFGIGAFLGTLFLLPLYLQESRHFSPLTSGLTTFPEALGVITSMQLMGRLYPRIGPRRLTSVGLAFMCACLLVLSFSGDSMSLWTIRLLIFAVGFGMGAVILSVQAAAYATISPADSGHASAIFSTQMQASSATAIAVLGTILSAVGGRGIVPKASSFGIAFVVAAGGALVGSIMALRVNDADALATMVHPHSTNKEAGVHLL